jgi:hypothetical protein
VASGPGQPPAGPSRLADSLARYRWVTAAGMTVTIAAVAGGGLALALHDSSAGPPKECGLVPCAAALPASVQTSGDGSARAPATAAPTAAQRGPAPSSPAPSPTSPAPSAAAPEAAAPEAAARPDQPASAGRVSGPGPRSSCRMVSPSSPGDTLSPVGAGSRCPPATSSRDGSGHPVTGPPVRTPAGGQPGVRPGWPQRLGGELAEWGLAAQPGGGLEVAGPVVTGPVVTGPVAAGPGSTAAGLAAGDRAPGAPRCPVGFLP